MEKNKVNSSINVLEFCKENRIQSILGIGISVSGLFLIYDTWKNSSMRFDFLDKSFQKTVCIGCYVMGSVSFLLPLFILKNRYKKSMKPNQSKKSKEKSEIIKKGIEANELEEKKQEQLKNQLNRSIVLLENNITEKLKKESELELKIMELIYNPKIVGNFIDNSIISKPTVKAIMQELQDYEKNYLDFNRLCKPIKKSIALITNSSQTNSEEKIFWLWCLYDSGKLEKKKKLADDEIKKLDNEIQEWEKKLNNDEEYTLINELEDKKQTLIKKFNDKMRELNNQQEKLCNRGNVLMQKLDYYGYDERLKLINQLDSDFKILNKKKKELYNKEEYLLIKILEDWIEKLYNKGDELINKLENLATELMNTRYQLINKLEELIEALYNKQNKLIKNLYEDYIEELNQKYPAQWTIRLSNNKFLFSAIYKSYFNIYLFLSDKNITKEGIKDAHERFLLNKDIISFKDLHDAITNYKKT